MTYSTIYQRLRAKQITVAKISQIEIWLNREFEINNLKATGDEIQTAMIDNQIKAIEYAARFNKESYPFKRKIEGLDYWNIIDALGVYSIAEKKQHCANMLGVKTCESLFAYLRV